MVAIKTAKELRKLLKKLRKEMQDVALRMDIRDTCLDTRSPDWCRVISASDSSTYWEEVHISNLLEQITMVSDDISRTRKKLETYISESKTNLTTKETELKEIMFR